MKEIDWRSRCRWEYNINPLNAKLNPICHLLASLLGAHHILHVGRIRVNRIFCFQQISEKNGS